VTKTLQPGNVARNLGPKWSENWFKYLKSRDKKLKAAMLRRGDCAMHEDFVQHCCIQKRRQP
jgi:hypothetical protein